MKNQTVSIIIPNWNGAKLLVEHLPKVLAACPGCEVIVVDDKSTDDSVSILKKKFPGVITIVKKENSGFAKSVNVGVARAKHDIVVLLNTDVVPEKGFLSHLLPHFSDSTVFAVGCMEKNPEKEGVVLRGRGIAHWRKGFYIHARGEVDKSDTAWASGGSSAFRKDIWERLGGMDTIYNPFYWEDIDLSYRAMKAGYRIVFEPKAEVWHFHQKGAIKTQFEMNKVERIVFRNQFIFIWKNLSDLSLWVAHLFWTPVRVLQELVKGKTTMFVGLSLAVGKLPKIVTRRMKQQVQWEKKDQEIRVY